eukprot:9378607-Pyramimonas_sp.AAC.1
MARILLTCACRSSTGWEIWSTKRFADFTNVASLPMDFLSSERVAVKNGFALSWSQASSRALM